ncbi:MAG: hypothetical protein QOK42_2150, partial [Frankiaceae bacterium]|nr:hypothetical protein [Frankiaceae bacterium]
SIRLRIQRDVETAGIPDFARKLLGERQTITEIQEWSSPTADGSRSGTWKVEAKSAPMQMGGRLAMAPSAGGTTVTIEGEVKASVPLIGGKLERAVAEATEKTLKDECAFGQKWLASH